VTLSPGQRLSVKKAAGLVKPGMWQRMRTGSATRGAKDYDWAMIVVLPGDTPAGQDDGHAFQLLRKHRYSTAARSGDAATSITRGKPTSAGTPTPTSCPDNDLQLPWKCQRFGDRRSNKRLN